jgi:hypothetical protein
VVFERFIEEGRFEQLRWYGALAADAFEEEAYKLWPSRISRTQWIEILLERKLILERIGKDDEEAQQFREKVLAALAIPDELHDSYDDRSRISRLYQAIGQAATGDDQGAAQAAAMAAAGAPGAMTDDWRNWIGDLRQEYGTEEWQASLDKVLIALDHADEADEADEADTE